MLQKRRVTFRHFHIRAAIALSSFNRFTPKYSYPALAQTIQENALKRRSRNVYRDRYQDYSRRVKERPEFADASRRVIDVAITIMLFKEMLNQDERAFVLSQSDQIQEWRETLDKSEFLETKAQLTDESGHPSRRTAR